jgi:hypothetical protein
VCVLTQARHGSQVFTIYNEIVAPSRQRMRVVISSSISTGFLVYLTIATTGYLTYGSELEANILNSCTLARPRDLLLPRSPRVCPVWLKVGCRGHRRGRRRDDSGGAHHGHLSGHFLLPTAIAPSPHLPGQHLSRRPFIVRTMCTCTDRLTIHLGVPWGGS